MRHLNPIISASESSFHPCLRAACLQPRRRRSAKRANHPVLTGQAAFTDAPTSPPASAAISPWPTCPRPRPSNPSTTAPPSFPGPPTPGPSRPRASKSSSTPPVSTIPACCAPRPTATSFWPKARPARSRSSAASAPTASRKQISVFADGLHQPFGIAFYPSGPNPQWVYIGDTDGIVRFPYKNGDLKASGPMEQHRRSARRRTPARRRPLDARPGLLERRHQALRLGRLPLQCRRLRHPSRGVPPRRRARVHARGQVRQGLRLGPAQLRRRSHQPHHRRAVVLHQ